MADTGDTAPSTAPPRPPAGRFASAMDLRFGGLPREFWYVWVGSLVNRAGTFVEPFLVLYLTGEMGVSASTAGTVLGVIGAGSLVSQLTGGVLADRIGRRETLLVGMLSFAVALGVLGAARSLAMIFVGAALLGLTVNLYRPAATALIADVVPPADRARAYGLHFWSINLGFSVAMLLAGLLARSGYTLLFLLDALTAVVFGVLVYRGIGDTRPQRAASDAPDPGLRAALRDRLLLGVLATWLVYSTVTYQSFSTLPLAMRDSGLDEAAFGITIAVNGVVIVVGQPLAAAWLARRHPIALQGVSMALAGIGFALTGLADSMVEYALTVIVWTLAEIGTATTGSTVIAAIAPPELRGRYAGVFGLAFGGGAIVAPIAGTWVFQNVGPAAVWWACLAAGVVMAAAHVPLGRSYARRQVSQA